jgi:cytochrome b6-f complex iron-sulfur subunit
MAEETRQQGLFYPGAEAAREVERRTASPRAGDADVVPARRGFWTRRSILRWAGWGTIMLLLGQWSVGFVQFFWPKKVGAFGGQINAGAVEEMQVGDVKVLREGKFYVSRVPEGVLALWWKCPHLGCTVPWKPDDPSMDQIAAKGRFNCPCHGSIYDRYGQIVSGPAPRPMDLFPVEVREGRIYVNTNPTTVVTRTTARPSDATPA